jgi:acetyl-CoA C-acetyltransferase
MHRSDGRTDVSRAADEERTPVVVASGQAVARGPGEDDLVTPVDLMARAVEAALVDVPGLRSRVQRLSVVDIMSRTGPAPASELAARCGLRPGRVERTTIGGNSPQWLLTRAAADIASGQLGASVIAGAEALRSQRARRAAGLEPVTTGDGEPDPVVGDDRPGIGPGEAAIGLVLPVNVYPMLESAVAARAGRSTVAHREVLGRLFAPFTEVAADNPYAWFREVLTADEIATPSPENRVVSEPYTKRMAAFLGSDQAAALVVCSLAEARRAGVADRAVFVWAGADATDVRAVSARPDPATSPAIAAAGRALFAAATEAVGRAVSVDDVTAVDLYSCFPVAVELACDALGIATDDPRGLTLTGGLPYFGGPGNNYTAHGIAEVTDRVRTRGGIGLASGLGWFVTKHSLGLYASEPAAGGFRRGDTSADQAAIDASAAEVALEVPEPTVATVVAATVARDRDGRPSAAPVVARLADGRQVAAAAGPDALAAAGELDVARLVGERVTVAGSPPAWSLLSP